TDRSRRSLDESRRRVRDAAVKVETSTPEEPAVEMAALAPGATVAAEHLGVRGELVEIAGSSATVRSGSVTVRVPVSALRPAAAAPGTAVPSGGRRAANPGSALQGPHWGMSGARIARRSSDGPDVRSAPSDPSSCCSARRPTRLAIGSSSIWTTRFSRVWPACGWFMARAPARSEGPFATCWPVTHWSSRSGTVSPRRAARARPWPRSRSANGPVFAIAARRHPRRHRHRRPRRPLREPEEGGHRLEGPLPVPFREDALLHGQPAQGHLSLLRLRGWGRRVRLPDAPGSARVPRGRPHARQDGRHRADRRARPGRRFGPGRAAPSDRARGALLPGAAHEAVRRAGAR